MSREVAAALRETALRLLDWANQLDPTDIDVDASGSPGSALIGRERIRQITDEGFTAAHDRSHDGTELAWGAFSYCERAAQTKLPQGDPSMPHLWPWNRADWKPSDSVIRNLTKAGALIAAEIDRRYAAGERP